MLKQNLLNLLYDALETEGEKQEVVVELSVRKGIISIIDEEGKEWLISVTLMSRKK